MSGRVRSAAWCVTAALLSACGRGGADGGLTSGGERVAAGNPFPTASIALHPLTRVSRAADGRLQIDAHVEMLAEFGEGTRDVGVLRFTARRGDGDASGETRWVLDLRRPEASARQYDRVTRTYAVTLEDAPAWVGESGRVTLRVEMDTSGGSRVAAERRIGR